MSTWCSQYHSLKLSTATYLPTPLQLGRKVDVHLEESGVDDPTSCFNNKGSNYESLKIYIVVKTLTYFSGSESLSDEDWELRKGFCFLFTYPPHDRLTRDRVTGEREFIDKPLDY